MLSTVLLPVLSKPYVLVILEARLTGRAGICGGSGMTVAEKAGACLQGGGCPIIYRYLLAEDVFLNASGLLQTGSRYAA